MAYSSKTWEAWPSLATPMNAVGLNDLESRISSAFLEKTDINHKTTQSLLLQAGDPLVTLASGLTQFELAPDGSVLFGHNPNLVRLGATRTVSDSRNAIVDFVWDAATRRFITRMGFFRETSNPPNIQKGRYPGKYPYSIGWTTLHTAVTLGGGTTELEVEDLDGFVGNEGDTGIGEAILEDGGKIGHITWTGKARLDGSTWVEGDSPCKLTGVVVTEGSGLSFSTSTTVTDALKPETTISIDYGTAWAGRGGFRDRLAQITYTLKETAKPDADGSGLFHQAGAISFSTSSPGAKGIPSQRTEHLELSQNGKLVLFSYGLDAASNAARRVVFTGPSARLRNSGRLLGSASLPQATIPMRSVSNIRGTSGTVLINESQTVTFTGVDPTAKTLTGCAGGTGTMPADASVVQIFTLPVTTLDLDSLYGQFKSNYTSGRVKLGTSNHVLAYSGVNDSTLQLNGVSTVSGSGTFRGDEKVTLDVTSQNVILGVWGQIAANDKDSSGRVVIGNIGPTGFEPGVALGSGDTYMFRNTSGGWKVSSTVPGQPQLTVQAAPSQTGKIMEIVGTGGTVWDIGNGGGVRLLGAGADIDIGGNLAHKGANLGFFNTAVTAKKTVTGSRGGIAALASLLTELAAYGLLIDSSTA